MRPRILRCAALAAAAVVVLGLGILTTPAFGDAPNSSITGTFTTLTGKPIARASVDILDEYQEEVATATTSKTGAYSVSSLSPGLYYVRFTDGNLVEFAPEKFYASGTNLFTVAASGSTVVDEVQLPTGRISGTVTDTAGAPAAGVGVAAISETGGGQYTTVTDATGAYAMTVYATPDYVLSYTRPDGLTQYAPNVGDQSQQGLYTVGAGKKIVVDEQELPTGTVSGTWLDTDGDPEAGTSVTLQYTDGSYAGSGTVDMTGGYSVTAFAGTYNVMFTGLDYRNQFAYQALDQADAASVTVVAGADSVVADTALPSGELTLTMTDSVTEAPLADFCAYVDSQYGCSDGNGQVVLDDIRDGTQTVYLYPTGARYPNFVQTQVVMVGTATQATIPITAGAVIRTTVVDAATGAPVADACVETVVPGFTVFPDGSGMCSDADGDLELGPLAPGSYNLFVNAPNPYGDQWVGPNGGTGRQQKATTVTVTTATTYTAPTIRLDLAGTITGTVTATDGTPLAGAVVGPTTFTPFAGGSDDPSFTDANGAYTINNLGPYQWPLWSSATGFASQWGAGLSNRYQADTVQVVAGGSTTYNITMNTGALLSGRALKPDGTPSHAGGEIVIYNAKTGDPMGVAQIGTNGRFTLPVAVDSALRIEYTVYDGSTQYQGYFGGTSATTAQVVHVPATGRTIHIVMAAGTVS